MRLLSNTIRLGVVLSTVIPFPTVVALPAASRATAYIVALSTAVFANCVLSNVAVYGGSVSVPSEVSTSDAPSK